MHSKLLYIAGYVYYYCTESVKIPEEINAISRILDEYLEIFLYYFEKDEVNLPMKIEVDVLYIR